MISGGGEGPSPCDEPSRAEPPPSLPSFHSTLYLRSPSAVTRNEARAGDGVNQGAKASHRGTNSSRRGPADHSGDGTYFSIMLCRFPRAVPCASRGKRAVYYSMMCLPMQRSHVARGVTDSNDVTCVPANDSPQGEVLGIVGELFSSAGHSRSPQMHSENWRAFYMEMGV